MFLRALALLLLTGFVCLPQWSLPDWVGTEGRRLQIAFEMADSGDWLVPTLGGQPTWAKPPLHYWIQGALSFVSRTDHWLLRLPAVLALFAAAWLGLELHRRWFSPAAGWVVALGVITAPVVVAGWPSVEIDPLFAALTAMSLWCLATGVARERRGLVFWSGVLGGLAMLQKGPPYFLFASGAYLVWWRRRGLRQGLPHFVPLLLLPLAYYVPLWCLRVAPGEMLAVASDESVGRVATFQMANVLETPLYWLRAAAVQLPLLLWCFWEWRGARDARMDATDLTLRMCSGAAVLAVVILTFFPGRPTRYLLPNVLLFPFAVAPAVAHYAGAGRELGRFARRGLRVAGVLGALALPVVPWFADRIGYGAAGLALGVALLPILVRTPRHLVAACFAIPVLAGWTVILDRAAQWPETGRARAAAGAVLRAELAARGALSELASHGHIEGPMVLGAGVLPPGDEFARQAPTARWVLHEAADRPPRHLEQYRERLRLCLPKQTFAVRERAPQ